MTKKNTKVKTMMIAALGLTLVTGMTSCKKEGCMDSNATNYNADAKKDDGSCAYASTGFEDKLNSGSQTTLNADITKNVTLPGKDYVLSGGIHVKAGVTLTIPAGATFKSDPNESIAYLLIEQGAKIIAVGTETSPIVFTSGAATPARGDWGGIIICGNAPINGGSRTAEVGNVTYGGSDAADNSGTLKYIRLEYTGNAINAEKEHNGFSFNGVGNGTVAEYLQVYKGGDDGFEFFGGTVNIKHCVSTGNQDDSFDWTQGWRGNGQFLVVEQNTDAGDRGFEGDNNSSNDNATPISNPTLSNITLIGADDGDASNQGLKLREGMKGSFYNFVITGFPKRGCQVEHDITITNMNNNDLTFKNSIIDNASPFAFTNSDGTDASVTNMFDDAANANQTATDGSLISFLSGYVGTSSTGGYATSNLGSWFTSVSYIGAVESGNDWTASWTKAL